MIWKLTTVHLYFAIIFIGILTFSKNITVFFFFKMKFVYFVNFKISKLMHQYDQAISET